ncbi:MAG: PilZ domain-containing protein [Acidobacteriia bacterium]|nr:PilZ domain-containing protein [Terriglobia bacterium]
MKSLLLSKDEKTVRVLRRVLSDLEIDVEHCSGVDEAIRRITRQRFEAIIADGANVEDAGSVLRGVRAAPVNKRALTVVLVEAPVGLKGGFELGAHFVLHKPLAVERAKASFRAVRAMMKRERRLQLRVAVQIPVECYGWGSRRYRAQTIDLCEGGMAIQFAERFAKENSLRFSFELPGMTASDMGHIVEIHGDLAWEGDRARVGVRFTDATEEQRHTLRRWLNAQLPEPEQDDPPVNCRLTDLSLGGCYLATNSPFPRRTRIILKIRTADLEIRAGGIVLVAHPEFGMGVEFLQSTTEQRDQVLRLITTLRANGDKSPQLQVEPDGLETPSSDAGVAMFQSYENERSAAEDTLVDLFRQKFEMPVDAFLEQMRAQRHAVETQAAKVSS